MALLPPATDLLAVSARADAPARADAAPGPRVTETRDAVSLTVPATRTSPGYTVDVASEALTLTTERASRTVLRTKDAGALRFRSDGTWQHATELIGWTFKDGVLTLTADTTLDGATVEARLTPKADRYQLDWDVEGGNPDQLSLAYDLPSAGHWYGHGEAETPVGGPGVDQPWPLDGGEVEHKNFGPAS